MDRFKMVRTIIYVLSVFLGIMIIWKIYDVTFGEQNNLDDKRSMETVGEVFEDVGIGECDSTVEAFYYYGTMYLEDDEKEQVLDDIAGKLGIVTKCDYSSIKTDTGSEYELKKTGVNSDVNIKLITYEVEEGESLISLRQYISVKLKIQNSIESALYYKEKLNEIMNNQSVDLNKNFDNNTTKDDLDSLMTTVSGTTLNLSITGYISGKLSIEAQKKIANIILQRMNGELVFDNDEEGYSLYGYTSNISEYMTIGNSKINVNVAYGYDELQNKTIIYVASPIIEYDY